MLPVAVRARVYRHRVPARRPLSFPRYEFRVRRRSGMSAAVSRLE